MEHIQSSWGCHRSRTQQQKQGKDNLPGISEKICVIKGQLVQEKPLWCFRSAWHLRSQLPYGVGSRSCCFYQALSPVPAACKARTYSALPTSQTCLENPACQDKGVSSPAGLVQSVLGSYVLTQRAQSSLVFLFLGHPTCMSPSPARAGKQPCCWAATALPPTQQQLAQPKPC